ncbi:MAG: DUF502 domain-containing protein [Ignavibacteriae bacterium]|nr:DUF502 domain-containing protein [Ignavibacteriota bacterium]MCB9208440.1 DUF502 domain-containing protein [Ignavibacteriales bacterium]MCB9258452.1 DUF502 domain-containing protein [Ignavibacteriales bacterium]
MDKIKSFVSTTFIGGFLIFLPLVILVITFNWMFEVVSNHLRPISKLLVQAAKIHEFFAFLISVIIFLGICFLLGLFVKTRHGNLAYNLFEENILKKVPGYRIVKETIVQLFGSQKNLFSGVALINLFGNETLTTAFITDVHSNGWYTVFIPSGPAPTAGFTYHLPAKYVHKINYPVDLAMKTIISLGAGSKKILEMYKPEENLNKN